MLSSPSIAGDYGLAGLDSLSVFIKDLPTDATDHGLTKAQLLSDVTSMLLNFSQTYTGRLLSHTLPLGLRTFDDGSSVPPPGVGRLHVVASVIYLEEPAHHVYGLSFTGASGHHQTG